MRRREGQRPEGDKQWFTPEECELVNALVCVLIPASEDVPGASDMEIIGASAVRQIESMVAAQQTSRPIVVATRFHAILLGILRGRATVRICYQAKSRRLLEMAGLGDYGVWAVVAK